MTANLIGRRVSLRRVAFLSCLLILALSRPARSEDFAGADLLPAGSLGFVHVQVDKIANTSSFEYLAQVVGQVDEELANFSLNHLGLDATRLCEVTVVVPPLEILSSRQGGDEPPVLIAASFGSEFNPDDVTTALTEGWDSAVTDGVTYYHSGEEHALFVASSHTVLFGPEAAVKWWIHANQSGSSSDLADTLRSWAEEGQVSVGIDASQIPAEFRQMVPPPVAFLSQAQFVSAVVDLDDGLSLGLELDYPDEATAGQATQMLNAIKQQALAVVSFQEAEFLGELNKAEVGIEEGLAALAGLAGMRQAVHHLEEVELHQDEETVVIEAEVESNAGLMVLAALTGVQAIGAQANAEFEMISAELEAQETEYEE